MFGLRVGVTMREFNSAGAGVAVYGDGGILGPLSVAVDGSGNVWVPNNIHSSVPEYNNAGLALFTVDRIPERGFVHWDRCGDRPFGKCLGCELFTADVRKWR
jgi:hypothetical protein